MPLRSDTVFSYSHGGAEDIVVGVTGKVVLAVELGSVTSVVLVVVFDVGLGVVIVTVGLSGVYDHPEDPPWGSLWYVASNCSVTITYKKKTGVGNSTTQQSKLSKH